MLPSRLWRGESQRLLGVRLPQRSGHHYPPHLGRVPHLCMHCGADAARPARALDGAASRRAAPRRPSQILERAGVRPLGVLPRGVVRVGSVREPRRPLSRRRLRHDHPRHLPLDARRPLVLLDRRGAQPACLLLREGQRPPLRGARRANAERRPALVRAALPVEAQAHPIAHARAVEARAQPQKRLAEPARAARADGRRRAV
mmetsp:Transcript_19368/g.48391  ORF Transcript_19368/g.48391 Transcript_19368/m.48391 type:complete len:202 (-) Transcript_19368:441-1046(-)